jgi:hypothetical protein
LAAGVHLEVYGLTIAVGGDWPEVCERVRLDYAWFQSPVRSSTPDVEVTIEHRPPDYGSFADAIPWFVTPRNAVYRLGSRIVLDHIGVAVSVLDANEKGLWIQGEDEHVVHDAVYYFLLGRIGQHLDARGLVRLHALGLAGRPGAVALLLPPGGGKTTLALEAIKDDAVAEFIRSHCGSASTRTMLSSCPPARADASSASGCIRRSPSRSRRSPTGWLPSRNRYGISSSVAVPSPQRRPSFL